MKKYIVSLTVVFIATVAFIFDHFLIEQVFRVTKGVFWESAGKKFEVTDNFFIIGKSELTLNLHSSAIEPEMKVNAKLRSLDRVNYQLLLDDQGGEYVATASNNCEIYKLLRKSDDFPLYILMNRSIEVNYWVFTESTVTEIALNKICLALKPL